MTPVLVLLLVLLVIAGLWTVLVPNLLMSAIWLALTSVILTVLMFQLNAPLAAVFELSVCAGLITVIFVSAISLTKPLTKEEDVARVKARLKRYVFLPVILAAVGWGLWAVPFSFDFKPNIPTLVNNVRDVIWQLRRFDLIGQLAIILTGIFGVVVLFKTLGKGEAGK